MLNPKLIHGITVTLYVKSSTEVDAFNRPVITETAVTVDNVLHPWHPEGRRP